MIKRNFLLIISLALILFAGVVNGERAKAATAPQLTVSHEEAEAWAEKILAKMTLEQKAGQMMFEVLDASYKASDDSRFLELVELVREYSLGGFVLSGGTPHDTPRLLNRLQEEAEIPIFISNAFEGGPGQMIRGATEFPPNMAFSATRNEKLAEEAGRIGAREGRAMGVHITWSPTVDILTRPDNPVQSVRSFGEDLKLLGKMAAAYIRGYQENGMLACAKHFPGRGDVDLIPGTEFTVNNKPAARVESEDFFAFKQAIDAGVVFIMSDHIAVPSVADGSMLPGSMEPKLATHWLRKKLGFRNILISDDMWYEKVIKRFGLVESSLSAIKAGHDAILKPGNTAATIKALAEAVRMGEISEERIDNSVRKLLYWKARLNLHRNRFVDESKVRANVNIKEHREFVNTVADRSLTLLVNKGYFPSGPEKVGKVLHLCFQREDVHTAPAQVAAKIAAAFPVDAAFTFRPGTSDKIYSRALKAVKNVDTVILSLFNSRIRYVDNGPLAEEYLRLIRKIIRLKPKSTVIMSYGNPYLVEPLKDAAAFVLGYGEGGFYGNQIVYADAFIRLLQGNIAPVGELPITVSEDFPFGSGVVY